MKRIITTGGTIDKVYKPLRGELTFDRSFVRAILDRINYSDPFIIEELLQIDSLDMTDEDRKLIADACTMAWEKSIVVTHGTDTMPETARFIKDRLGRNIGARTIVLTGAMVPYSVEETEASFNLGTALAYAGTLDPGVYVAMNGHAFEADDVIKDTGRGIFIRPSLSDQPQL